MLIVICVIFSGLRKVKNVILKILYHYKKEHISPREKKKTPPNQPKCLPFPRSNDPSSCTQTCQCVSEWERYQWFYSVGDGGVTTLQITATFTHTLVTHLLSFDLSHCGWKKHGCVRFIYWPLTLIGCKSGSCHRVRGLSCFFPQSVSTDNLAAPGSHNNDITPEIRDFNEIPSNLCFVSPSCAKTNQ